MKKLFKNVEIKVVTDLHSLVAKDETGETSRVIFNLLHQENDTNFVPNHRAQTLDILEDIILLKIHDERSVKEIIDERNIRRNDIKNRQL